MVVLGSSFRTIAHSPDHDHQYHLKFVFFFYRLLSAGHRKASTAEVLEIETSDNFEAVCLQYKHYPPIAGQYE